MTMPLRERFRRWMTGRYGPDALNRFLSAAAMVCLLLALLLRLPVLDGLALGLLLLSYWRLFSRDIARRAAENAAFCRARQRLLDTARQKRIEWAQRGQYRYYRCPGCRQRLRVPRGHGRIAITCPRCRTEFVKKS